MSPNISHQNQSDYAIFIFIKHLNPQKFKSLSRITKANHIKKKMSELHIPKLSNNQRLRKRQRILNQVRECWTPPKYNKHERIERKFGKMEERFGYDYGFQQFKRVLRNLYEEFEHNAMKYLGNRELARKMGRQFKRERNQQYNRPLKTHPLLRIFNRLQNNWNLQAKAEGLLQIKAIAKGK